MTTSDNAETKNQSTIMNDSGMDEINLLDILIVLFRHKKMILSVTFGAAFLTAAISLLLPNIYTATTRILPPQPDQYAASSMLNQVLGRTGGLAGAALGLKNPNELFVGILESNTVMENVAKRFGLQDIYGTKTMADTLIKLDKNTSISSNKDGIIEVDVDDKDPARAADMANAFIEELNKLMQTFSLSDASHRRLFFEQQLKSAKAKLTDAEVLLDRTPNTSLQYMDALRNMKYRESIYEILAKQYEMAKLDEAKDYPLIQVLDKASVPENKSQPKRSLIVIVAIFAAFILSIFWALMRESILRAKERPDQAERIELLRNAVRFRP